MYFDVSRDGNSGIGHVGVVTEQFGDGCDLQKDVSLRQFWLWLELGFGFSLVIGGGA